MYSRGSKIARFVNYEGSEVQIYYQKGSFDFSRGAMTIQHPEIQVYVDDFCQLMHPLSRHYERDQLRQAVRTRKKQWEEKRIDEIIQEVENFEEDIH